MKHYLLTIISFLIVTGAIQSQHLNIGIKGGLNTFNIMGNNGTNYQPKIGYVIGLLGHIHKSNRFALQPEILYSVQGAKSNLNFSKNLNYVNIPLLFQYMYNNGFRLQAGPQLGLLVSAKAKASSGNVDIKKNYKSTDLGLTLGMSYVKPSTGYGFDIRYNHGLTDINKSSIVNYNRGVQLSVFYLFDHKS